MIYEVNLTIPYEIKAPYNKWLEDHIKEMCTIDGFLHVVILKAEEDSSTHYKLCIQYHLQDRQTFTNYEREHAERMRGDGLKTWGSQIQASRRLLRTYELTLERTSDT